MRTLSGCFLTRIWIVWTWRCLKTSRSCGFPSSEFAIHAPPPRRNWIHSARLKAADRGITRNSRIYTRLALKNLWGLLDCSIPGLCPITDKMHHVQWLGCERDIPPTRGDSDDPQSDAGSIEICGLSCLLDCPSTSSRCHLFILHACKLTVSRSYWSCYTGCIRVLSKPILMARGWSYAARRGMILVLWTQKSSRLLRNGFLRSQWVIRPRRGLVILILRNCWCLMSDGGYVLIDTHWSYKSSSENWQYN